MKLATDEAASGNIGTRFIPQAMTWLYQQRWADHAAVAALAQIAGTDLSIEEAIGHATPRRAGAWNEWPSRVA